MEVILVRHGITQGNKEKRFVGRLDVPLAPEGEAMARETAPLMPEVEHLYVSPMLRCRQTAELLWPGVPRTLVEDLRETDRRDGGGGAGGGLRPAWCSGPGLRGEGRR